MKKAVLLIHGFAGGIYDLEYLHNALLDNKYKPYVFTLPGHKTYYSNHINSSEWSEYSEEQLKLLIDKGYEEIYIIAHSMGGVIGTFLASKYPQVKKLVLLAPAFNTAGGPGGEINFSEIFKEAPKIFKEYKSNQLINQLMKLPPSSIKEFKKLVKKHKDSIKEIYMPVLILQGEKDFIVPGPSSLKVYNNCNSPNKQLIFYKNANHLLLDGEERDEVVKDVLMFLTSNKRKNEEIIRK